MFKSVSSGDKTKIKIAAIEAAKAASILESEDFEVYGLIDAAGDSTPDAHKYRVKRMLQARVIPITLESLVSEWMHDWKNPKAGELVKEVYSKYGAMIGF
ncbi:MAG: hypothetical protein QG646_1308 [Euryarchaeota archaeon]|nr:hypothetical protein [Euryarchaeota archaeon]